MKWQATAGFEIVGAVGVRTTRRRGGITWAKRASGCKTLARPARYERLWREAAAGPLQTTLLARSRCGVASLL